MNYTIRPKSNLRGTFPVAPDKSISHRAVMFGSISNGVTEIENFLTGDDCIATINCFRSLGIEIIQKDTNVTVFGKGLYGLKKSSSVIDIGNSGTSIRLISGILSGQNFESTITGDSSIQKRPMDRIIIPLREMGANITGVNGTNFTPLTIKPSHLKGINFTQKVASAQVKSAIILAALYSDRKTTITEPIQSRNHTELMLEYLGADIKTENNIITVNPVKELHAKNISVPGDISSAAFFMVAALICEGSHLILQNVGLNETRSGIITVLKNMGGDIQIHNQKIVSGEKVGDIEIKYSKLSGTLVSGDLIPKLIDEIPVIAVAALFASGETTIKDAEELKVKESNRIKTVATEFSKFGALIKETDDGMIIQGNSNIVGATADSHGDHRIAMSLAILGLKASSETTIINSECASVSFPNFFQLIEAF